MPKIDLGEKQLCPSCGAKFYDLHKRPAKCPKCGNTFDPDDELVVATRQAARMSSLDTEDHHADDEDDDVVGKVKPTVDTEEEEVDTEETTKEIDIESMDEGDLIMGDDGDNDDDIPGTSSSESIPEGFSEQEIDEDEDAVDDEVPFLEDDDELFEEELAELDIEDIEDEEEK